MACAAGRSICVPVGEEWGQYLPWPPGHLPHAVLCAVVEAQAQAAVI